MTFNLELIDENTNFYQDGEYKLVNNLYLKEKILKGGYKRTQVTKIGQVSARPLNTGDEVCIYYYNHKAEIEEMPYQALSDQAVLVTKTIGGRHYNSVMDCLSFHKHYHWNPKVKAYVPVFDPFPAYEIDENIKFINMYKQEVTLHIGDLICPYDTAEFKKIYSIYKYNFDDNYAFVEDHVKIKENFDLMWNDYI